MTSTEKVPSQMKAVQLLQHHKPYQVVTVATPQPKDHELLVKIHAAGFCHSDLQVIQKHYDDAPLPIIPGHEPAGVIVKVGSRCNHEEYDNHTHSPFKVGDRVGVLNCKNACAACPSCSVSQRRYGQLHPRFCERRQMAGFNHDGCMAEYMVADPTTTVRLPDEVEFDQAATLMCAGGNLRVEATIWAALEKATANLEHGAVIAIIGIGGLGHLGIQFAKAKGFRIIALDNREAGRELAAQVPPDLSPDLILDSTTTAKEEEGQDIRRRIFSFTGGEGVAAAIVCTDARDITAWTLSILRIGGVVVPLGLPPQPWQFDPSLLVFRELTVRGSYVASADATKEMLEVVKKHDIRSQITEVALEDAPKLVDMYEDKSFMGRLVVKVA